MAVLLRNLLDGDIEAVLLEDPGLLGERQRRETGPPGNADGDLGVLGRGDGGVRGGDGNGDGCEVRLHAWLRGKMDLAL